MSKISLIILLSCISTLNGEDKSLNETPLTKIVTHMTKIRNLEGDEGRDESGSSQESQTHLLMKYMDMKILQMNHLMNLKVNHHMNLKVNHHMNLKVNHHMNLKVSHLMNLKVNHHMNLKVNHLMNLKVNPLKEQILQLLKM